MRIAESTLRQLIRENLISEGLLKPPPKMLADITDYLQGRAAGWLADPSKQKNFRPDDVFVDPEVMKLAAGESVPIHPKAWTVMSGEMVNWPVDLTGFPYPAEKAPKSILLYLNYKDPVPNVGGSYDPGLSVQIRDEKLFKSTEGYDKLMWHIESVVAHELEHFAQDLLKGVSGGLPSRKIRDKRFDKYGYPEEGTVVPREELGYDGRKKYFLQDTEFYPWIRSEVMAFERFARGLGDEERERARRSWVDPKESDILRAKADTLGEDESKFFSVLKDKEPLKWQKAVKEFWKSTER
jgi:hypothetical protein